ncbi:hypothetical protein SAMN05444422_11625 [Halobiforma haloterrestris]|uniref:Uncharacterized protein n=1 Tax=Natronobacterium haloterrestre TaxID=148448 RepID=A0A1I1LG30_NATHA|nr:hypothetical protein [Halobiforma haloterrestris]SFC71492.1 hypothetical protein SAMN05444422_11625 [Halobiforma haloterrestris]
MTMDRRQWLTSICTASIGAIAGCTGELEAMTEDVNEEATETVDETVSDLARPPNADVEIESDGTILVLSTDPGTVGVMCGLPETDDPVEEVRTADEAVTGPGEIEGCDAERIVAVNEAGDIEVVERLD